MKLILSVITTLLLSVGFFNGYSQGTSNKGTEFWTTYADHIRGLTGTNGNNGSKMSLYITSDVSTTGSVEFTDGTTSIPFTVTANQVQIVDIPGSQFLGHNNGKFNKGIHIKSDDPIAIYAHIYANNVSGATLLFPVSAMGKTYVSLNYTQNSNSLQNGQENLPSHSFFTVIATEDNTTVEITPSATLLDGSPSGTAIPPITLQKGQVYQGLSLSDLTGTKIISKSNAAGDCKKIAVFSGSSKMSITCNGNQSSSDNLFQQVYPTSAWGKNYVTVPLASRSYDIYRIVLSDTNTKVTLNGTQIDASQFTSGYYEFNSTNTNIISADQPIQVVQYSPSQGQAITGSGGCTTLTENTGDPEMIYLSPIEQGLNQVTLYSTGYFAITENFINVVIPSSAVPSFTLDGGSYTAFTVIPNSPYSFAQIPVNTGSASVTSRTHTIKASQPFNAIAYGFGEFESYGYAAGTNLQDLNSYVRFKNPVNNNIQTAGCAGVDYNLQVTLPYITTGITWKIDGNSGTTIANPDYEEQTVNGQKLYVYEYSTPVNFTPGSHKVKATVIDPNDECGATADVEHDFEITAPPTVEFTAPVNTCLGDATAFKDTSVPQTGATITSWLWDFGDVNSTPVDNKSTEQNPTHKYTLPGDYTVTFTATDNNGCSSVQTHTTHIAALPVANFSVLPPNCEGQEIVFTDGSNSTDGIINKWTWDFGDGSSVPSFTNGLPVVKHTYTAPGSYNVILWVTTDKGCTSAAFASTIIVNPTPVVDFALPEVCVSDPFAQFIDKSTVTGGTITSWLWDFGDAANSTLANPNTSSSKDPRHRYINIGEYEATLTVTTSAGCTYTKSQKFIVSSSMPKAKFSYPTTTCSSDDVLFKDESNVAVGNIIRVDWYFDFKDHPTVFEKYTTANMNADKIYRHNYGLNNTLSPKEYLVRMVVYSGESCQDIVEHTITVNPNPIVTLTPPSGLNLCQSDAPVQIIEDRHGFTGTPLFTGTGVSPTGLFDPKVSGPGTFTINYLFTTTSTGCTYATTMQITVNPTPVITLASNLQLLDGGQVGLNATTNISSGTMTYKWTPSTGLDRDDILNPVASPIDDITYTLTATSDKFCFTVASVTVSVLKAPIVNNTFTPNGDGINDTWTIKYLDSYPKATVAIFNRSGERLFFSNGYPIPWDGRYGGSDLPSGVYYYIINPNMPGRKVYSGYISIIR